MGVLIEAKSVRRNHEYGGYCCPFCMESNDYSVAGEDKTKVTCLNCDKPFAIWQEQVTENVSGRIREEIDE